MPALWQSSQRPMYVKTVWIDGFRHAVLSQDDPYMLKAKKRRPHSSASTFLRTPRFNNESSRNINFVIRSDKSKIQVRPDRTRGYNIERLNLTDVEPESDDELLVKATPQPLNEFDSYRSDNMKNLRLNRTARTEAKPSTELSDRVFQWLDLAGKIDLLAPESGERMSQPRHSWPEIQRRNNIFKSRTTIDVRKETVKIASANTREGEKPQNVSIDRHEIYMPTSANTIESYARQSRMKSTPRVENAKTKDLNKTKAKELKNNVMQARQKMATERHAVEKQYADLLSKKLIPDVSKNPKRQVHIFMPDVPKKTLVVTSRAESLLSQKTLTK
ncbi:uncharacterized protein LOC132902387 [Amyelois transitella]|uniref:uncharacterized protein LOC132902387 n=1 Tax=Amyelois transitella TaxID=680683 RepID=UPI0029900386|nr:uncharacterized protein LOC132902387 [Amyelois transitella]